MNKENQVVDAEFEAFANSGEVEVGDSNLASQETEKPAKAKREPTKPAEVEDQDEGDDQGDDGSDEGDDQGDDGSDEGDDQDDDQGDDDKPKKSAKDFQIERLKREKAELARQLREGSNRTLEEKVERLEKLLQGSNPGDNQDTGTPEPDPEDFEKYPLGHLDPAYIEDRIEYVADKKAAERADAVLQRQQQTQQLQPLLEKVDDLTVRGTEIYDDFKEAVVDTGMRGDWDLEQPTFEAAAEADHGAQILYELSQDPKEASRVAKLSPYQQIKYVADKDAEISKSKAPRRIPKAGDPPKNTARGANSRTQINPATDNLDDFEKAWEADARKSSR